MPTDRRRWFRAASSWVTRMPATVTVPASSGSSPLMQRSRVDLPEPDAPMSEIASCSPTARSIPRSTVLAPNRFSAPTISTSGPPAGLAGVADDSVEAVIHVHPVEVPLEQVVGEAGHRDGDDDEAQPQADHRRQVELVARVDAGPGEPLQQPDDGDEGGVLLQADEVVEQRRDDPAHGLGDDDEPHRLAVGEAQGPRRGRLAPVHALDAGPVDLGHVGAVDEGEGDDAQLEQRHLADDRQTRQGQAEPDQVDRHERGQAPEEVDVGDRQPSRRGRRPARGATAPGRRPCPTPAPAPRPP